MVRCLAAPRFTAWLRARSADARPSPIEPTRFRNSRRPLSGMAWAAVELPDPETPVGARGIGEPPVASGCAAVLNAISAALGDGVFRRAPVNLDGLLTALETGQPMTEPLTANV